MRNNKYRILCIITMVIACVSCFLACWLGIIQQNLTVFGWFMFITFANLFLTFYFTGLDEKINTQNEKEIAERAELARLKAKYEEKVNEK